MEDFNRRSLNDKKVAKCIKPGIHGSTFGGNPLAMSVGNGIDQINNPLLANVQKMSKFLFLNNILKKYPKIIKEIRGIGLLIRIQLWEDQTKFIKMLMNNELEKLELLKM